MLKNIFTPHQYSKDILSSESSNKVIIHYTISNNNYDLNNKYSNINPFQ